MLKLSKRMHILMYIVGALVLLAASWFFKNNINASCQSLVDYITNSEINVSLATFMALLSVAVVPLPGTLVVMTSGFLLGWQKGAAIAVLGLTCASLIGFLIGNLFRKIVYKKLCHLNWFLKIGEHLHRHPYKILVSLRFFPGIPFNGFNLACGCLSVPFIKFLFSSLLGLTPTLSGYAYLGSIVECQMIDSGVGLSMSLIIKIIIVMALIISLMFFGERFCRNWLTKKIYSKK